ncbi:hypothetical protein H2199_003083 [Coniosporium tulheliwenetii]|uniref:Uncharacterized protein n=1 Tax=Coniosporium tulheliwenetii TaxID=3383036 RepID=A0ACC2ZC90_9PEZI|nr:hypothetical protein H2199_003083 [Cladosporium sp. JES 115]
MGGPRIPAETRPRIPFSEGGPVYTSQDARSGGEPSSRWYSHATPQPRPSEGYGLQLGHGKKTPWRDEQRTGSDPAQRSGRQMPSQQSESRYRLADEDSAPVPRRTRLTKPPIKLVSVGGVPVDANAPSQNPTTAEAGSHEAANIASLTPKPLRINKEATPTTPTKARRASMDGDLVGAKQSPHKRDYSLASLATQFEQLSVASPKKDPLQGLAAYALLKTTPTKQATLPNWGLLESTEAMKKEEEAKSAPVAAAKNTTVAASMAKSKWAPTGAPVGMVQETLSPVAHYNSQALLHRPAEAAVMEAPRPESYSTSIPDVGTHATASREEKLATKPLNVEHDQPYDAGESVSPEYPRPTSSTASQAGSVLAEGPEEDDTIPHPAVGKPSLFNPEAARLAKRTLRA